MKRALATKKANFYTVDAVGLAEQLGLGGRINMIMQTVFFALAKVIPVEDAIAYLKKEIIKSYGDKGDEVIRKNNASVDEALKHLTKIDIPESWAIAELETPPVLNVPKSGEGRNEADPPAERRSASGQHICRAAGGKSDSFLVPMERSRSEQLFTTSAESRSTFRNGIRKRA